jgi:hypothetical protein
MTGCVTLWCDLLRERSCGAPCRCVAQVCFQLWMATTLLADALAVAAQTLLARSAGPLAGVPRCCLPAVSLSSFTTLSPYLVGGTAIVCLTGRTPSPLRSPEY